LLGLTDVGEKKRALVVDDDDPIRTMLAKVVERQNLDVDTARDGVEAIERIDEDGYSVIVLDLMMPRVDGWTFRERQLEMDEASDVPVVVLTAARQSAEDAQRLHAKSIIPKPFEIDTLVRAVNDVC